MNKTSFKVQMCAVPKFLSLLSAISFEYDPQTLQVATVRVWQAHEEDIKDVCKRNNLHCVWNDECEWYYVTTK